MLKLFVLVCIFSVNAVAICAEETLPVKVDNIKDVVVDGDSSPVAKQTSTDLRMFLKKLYGIDIPEIPSLNGLKKDESAIVIGRAAVSAGLVTKEELARVSPGGYVIKCSGNRIAIAGPDIWTTYFGMIGFLGKSGVRFYLPDSGKAYIPETVSRVIPPCAVFNKPVFGYRGGWELLFCQGSRILADPRKALNPELFDPKKTGSDLWIDHTAGYLVPKLLYYDQHPEYYAMGKDGKRIAKNAFSDHRTPLCLSNPDVTKISIERALKWVEMNPDSDFFGITYGDTPFWCQCPECLKLDSAPGEYASRLLHWVNPVAKAIGEKYPDKIVTTFAYCGSNRVPSTIRPEKNLWMVVATGAGNIPFFDHAIAQGNTPKEIEEWLTVAPGRLMVCEYLGGYEPAMIDQMSARLRYYAKIGLFAIKTTYSQGPTNFRQVWQYVWTKMNWDPAQDAQALAADFIRFYYGSAAEPLCRYFNLVHGQYVKTLSSGTKLVNSYPPDFYTDDFVTKCVACFDEAIATVSGDPKLGREIESEKMFFMQDALAHLGSYELDDGKRQLISFILQEAVKSAERSGKSVEFRKDVDLIARDLAAKNANPKLLDFIREKVGGSPVYAPEKINGGLRFSPAVFVGADYGPGEFGPTMSHKEYPSPPKICAGVYTTAKDSKGNPTSSEMKIAFTLEQIPGDGAATLDLEGQDGISKWAAERDFNILSYMRITVNGREICNGECGFVRGNWSRRTFDIPAGILKVGNNEIALKNTTKKCFGPFATCWVLVSDAQLIFKKN